MRVETTDYDRLRHALMVAGIEFTATDSKTYRYLQTDKVRLAFYSSGVMRDIFEVEPGRPHVFKKIASAVGTLHAEQELHQ